jgi:hypothetical protein
MLIGHIADVLTLIGEIIIAYAVIAVHDRMREEHKIDAEVYKTMRRERMIMILGIVLLFAGFSLRIIERTLS